MLVAALQFAVGVISSPLDAEEPARAFGRSGWRRFCSKAFPGEYAAGGRKP